MSPRNGSEWWSQLPDRLAEVATLVPGLIVVGLVGWVIFGAI